MPRNATLALSNAIAAGDNLAVARALRKRDGKVIAQLIEHYQHRLLRYLLYLTAQRELAEDLFQEVWIRVMERGSQYTGKARFDTWLFSIARNLVIDNARKRTCASLDELCDTKENERSFEIAGDGPSPFDSARSGEIGGAVAAALTRLDANHREALLLRFHEDLTLEEIAQVTRAPLSTVKSRLYRGLAALRPHLEAAGYRAQEASE
jgi:RNA polymerase sigma-70 factor, ECF subfamily